MMPTEPSTLFPRLRRDVRDLVLIVLGVVLALGSNAWWARGQHREAERVLLRAMRASLRDDLDLLSRSIANQRRTERAAAGLIDHLSRKGAYADSLQPYFGWAYTGALTMQPNIAAYEALKARGLDLVVDDSLRIAIIDVYETAYGRLRLMNAINQDVAFTVLRPYYLTHFRDLRIGESATPLDYPGLVSDQYFLNLLAYRLQITRVTLLPFYQRAEADVRGLLSALDRELSQH